MKNLIVRILGNDIPVLHSAEQTIRNLTFTLENEGEFEDTHKLYVLNRIADLEKKAALTRLLDAHHARYLDVPFEFTEIQRIPPIGRDIEDLIRSCDGLTYTEVGAERRATIANAFLGHSIYLININACRNRCIEYGKSAGYEWTFVLDSNSFFTRRHFQEIAASVREDTEYLSIPQVALSDGPLRNEDVLMVPDRLERLPLREHQLAFRRTSALVFNERIPYGLMDKAELLNALGVPGEWAGWSDIELIGVKQRPCAGARFEVLSRVVRLQPFSASNTPASSWSRRLVGVLALYRQLRPAFG